MSLRLRGRLAGQDRHLPRGHGPQLQRRRRITYAIKPTFRYSDDRLLGAITFTAPSTITIPARSARSFTRQDDDQRRQAPRVDPRLGRERARGADPRHPRIRRVSQPRQHQDLERQRRSAPPGLARPAAAVRQRRRVPPTAEVDTTIPDGALAGLPAADVTLTNAGVGHRDRGRLLVGRPEPDPARGSPRDEYADHRPAGRRRADLPGAGGLLLGLR